MIGYKSYSELADLLKRHYKSLDDRHAVDRDDDRLEFGAGDWANPIDVGESNQISAKRVSEPPANAYIFSRLFDDHGVCYFLAKLGPNIVSVKRVTHAEALELETEDDVPS